MFSLRWRTDSGRKPPRALLFRRDSEGAAAIEFAMVVGPFLALVGLIMETAFQAYSLASLDDALRRASRGLQIGTTQLSGQDVAGFNADICRLLPGWMSCDKLVTEVRTIGAYEHFDLRVKGPDGVNIGRLVPIKATQAENIFCPGLPGVLTLVRANYQIPALFGFWIASKAAGAYVISSAHTFRVEPFTGAYPRPVACNRL